MLLGKCTCTCTTYYCDLSLAPVISYDMHTLNCILTSSIYAGSNNTYLCTAYIMSSSYISLNAVNETCPDYCGENQVCSCNTGFQCECNYGYERNYEGDCVGKLNSTRNRSSVEYSQYNITSVLLFLWWDFCLEALYPHI